jgi:transcriptional regulator with XRE-family HTH domain
MNANEIKLLIRKSGLYLYEVADEIGITDPTITRWLRRLDEEKTDKILKAVERLTRQNAPFN